MSKFITRLPNNVRYTHFSVGYRLSLLVWYNVDGVGYITKANQRRPWLASLDANVPSLYSSKPLSLAIPPCAINIDDSFGYR